MLLAFPSTGAPNSSRNPTNQPSLLSSLSNTVATHLARIHSLVSQRIAALHDKYRRPPATPEMPNPETHPQLLHKSFHGVHIGQTVRFDVEYSPAPSAASYAALPPKSLWLKVRNTEPLALRAAYVAGPYSLYVDCRPLDYSPSRKSFVTAEQPVFELQLHPGQVFYAELACHTFQPTYKWLVDVVSQMLFSVSQKINFEVSIATEKDVPDPDATLVPAASSDLVVTVRDTLDLWNLPVPDTSRPIHLVVLTHGLHANVSADMLFLKELIDSSAENIVVKGFFGNVCKTERGIKYLGSRVAEYVVDLLKNESLASASKISFVGHSLGGLVQTFAIAYLETNYSWVFQRLQPINFITLASPMLGVVHENPAYVKIALSAGVAGRTGHDLGLQFTEKDGKPLLLLLPSGPTHKILKRFVRRTVYANAFNDGIVPLRTSALLYLDYKGLQKILGSGPTPKEASETTTNLGKIPRDLPDSQQDTQTLAFLAMLSYFMPQKHAPAQDTNTSAGTEETTHNDILKNLHKPSMLESAQSLLLPPLPSMKYITDPKSREDVIIHDKIYTTEDIPRDSKDDQAKLTDTPVTPELFPPSENAKADSQGVIQRISTKSEEIKQLLSGAMTEHYEEEIAREYHKQMAWRKVLVNLKPDAHNNIVVRRRFSNAYGWPVAQHLVDNHFGISDENDQLLIKEDSLEVNADGEELTKLLSVSEIKKENAELDKEPILDGEHTWIKFNENTEIFDGPAGIFAGISERMLKLKADWDVNGLKALRSKPEESVPDAAEDKGVMGEFM